MQAGYRFTRYSIVLGVRTSGASGFRAPPVYRVWAFGVEGLHGRDAQLRTTRFVFSVGRVEEFAGLLGGTARHDAMLQSHNSRRNGERGAWP